MIKDENKEKAPWAHKVVQAMIEYWVNVLYLAIFFSVFTSYRRLILAHYQITYSEYGISLIKALVLAKVIMVVGSFRLGRHLDQKPLIFPTLYKSLVFTVSVAIFSVLESTVRALLQGEGLAAGWGEFMSRGTYELLAGSLVIFFAFIPFFAVKELGRLLGKGKIGELFFRRRVLAEPDLSGWGTIRKDRSAIRSAGDQDLCPVFERKVENEEPPIKPIKR